MTIRQFLSRSRKASSQPAIEPDQAVAEDGPIEPGPQANFRSLVRPERALADHDVKLWHQEVAQRLGRGDFYLVCQPSCDGFAVSITYKQGVLARAEAAGVDFEGQEITDTIRKISSVPKRLTGMQPPEHLTISGNLYVPLPDSVNKPEGGRSALKLLVVGISSSAGGRVPANQWAALAYLKAAGFDVSGESKLARTPQEVLDYRETLAHNLAVRHHPCGGMTVKVNRFDHQSLLEAGDDATSWALSYDFVASASTDSREMNRVSAQLPAQPASRQPLKGLSVSVEIKPGRPSVRQVENKVKALGGSIVRDLNDKADYIITDNAERGLMKSKLMRARAVGLREFIVYCNNQQFIKRLDDIIAKI